MVGVGEGRDGGEYLRDKVVGKEELGIWWNELAMEFVFWKICDVLQKHNL